MRAEGTVLRTDGEIAEVEVVQRSACVGCSAAACNVREGPEAGEEPSGRGGGVRVDCAGCGISGSSGGCSGCAGCHKSVKHVLTLKNDVGVTAGDKVYIESRAGVIFALCVVLFLLPLLISGAVYAAFWGGSESGIGALTAFLTAIFSFALLYLTAGRLIVRRCEYKMTKIIE